MSQILKKENIKQLETEAYYILRYSFHPFWKDFFLKNH